MKAILFILIAILLISTTESDNRRRRLRRQYNFLQHYNNQYGLYGPGGQGWINNYNNRYPNPNFVWNNNYNWNHGMRYPEWYYNSAKTARPSIVCLLFILFFSVRVY